MCSAVPAPTAMARLSPANRAQRDSFRGKALEVVSLEPLAISMTVLASWRSAPEAIIRIFPDGQHACCPPGTYNAEEGATSFRKRMGNGKGSPGISALRAQTLAHLIHAQIR